MKKIIPSFLIIVAAVGITAFGVTRAFFSDKETSTGNKFVAGKFNLKIDNTCHYNGKVCTDNKWNGTDEPCSCTWSAKDLTNELFFNFLDVKPGDNGEDTVSLHVDNNDSWMCAEIANIKNDDNGCDSPENKEDVTCGDGQGELGDNLFFTVWKDTDCDNVLDEATSAQCVTVDPNFDPGCGTVHEEGICNNSRPPGEPNHILCHWVSGSAEQILVNNKSVKSSYWPIADSTTGNPLPGGKDYCLGVKWNVPIETSNIIQTDSIEGDLVFTAVQSRSMNTFKCTDLLSEVCDGKDNNYNELIDEGPLWANKGQTCTVGVGACQSSGTYICNTSSPAGSTICSATAGNPGEEICDGIDNDCDGEVDEGNVCAVCGNGIVEGTEECDDGNQSNFDFCNNSCIKILDKDGDGYAGSDCNDSNASIHPGATEIAGNNLDEDCSGMIACYRDADNDTYGSSTVVPNGYPASGGIAITLCNANSTDSLDDTSNDCNDSNASIHPNAAEITGDGIDQNCDGVELCYADLDGDGYRTTSFKASTDSDCTDPQEALSSAPTDCNDSNPAIHPGTTETCNGLDDNCSGQVDESFPEQGNSCEYIGPGAWKWWHCTAGVLTCQ